MQIGQAFYCDGCGVAISSGTHCTECDPQNGAKPVTTFFTVTATMVPGGEPSGETGLQLLNEQERGFFSRFLRK